MYAAQTHRQMLLRNILESLYCVSLLFAIDAVIYSSNWIFEYFNIAKIECLEMLAVESLCDKFTLDDFSMRTQPSIRLHHFSAKREIYLRNLQIWVDEELVSCSRIKCLLWKFWIPENHNQVSLMRSVEKYRYVRMASKWCVYSQSVENKAPKRRWHIECIRWITVSATIFVDTFEREWLKV